MIETWCIPAIHDSSSSQLLAQVSLESFVNSISEAIGSFLPSIVGAILILILFWLGASLAATAVKALLRRTDIDNKIAAWMSGDAEGRSSLPVEQWAATLVYWIVLLFGLLAFFNALKLEIVSAPLAGFLEQIFDYLPRAGAALLWLGFAWVLATLSKVLLTRGLERFRLDDRLAEQSGGQSPFLINETLANTLYWFIFLLFLPIILDTLGLQGLLMPLQAMLEKILAYLPNILTAVAIGVIGWIVARVVRGLVTNFLAATGIDNIGARVGLSQMGGMPLSGIVGTVAYILILIPIAIAALDALRIQSVSAPAISMLEQVLDFLPQIFTAGLIIAVFFFLGRWISEFVTSLLTSLGFNNIFSALGLNPPPRRPEDPGEMTPFQAGSRTPSEFVGIVVWVAIELFAIVAAVDVLEIPALNEIVSGLLVIFGRILAGLVVLAVGLYLANLVYNLIIGSGSSQARLLGQVARISIIAFVVAMTLQQMGIAPDIVNLAFGLLLGALAVAVALAFGLGGRDIAAEKIREFLSSFQDGE
ncbi:mechanosensitive ion channel [Baaleninema sp.]|uniref:mechanosensitive ion channel n=1 Tax=Baaleninema sp. TaxID=3101197 RepID=UPI003D06C445